MIGTFSYTVDLNGGSNGVFLETYPDSSTLFGTFTYGPNGSLGNLFLNYQGEFQGDFDDMTLEFAEPPAPGKFTGIQKVGPTTGSMSGTFTFE